MAWTEGKVVATQHWTNRLFSIRFEANLEPFAAGQFARVGLPLDPSASLDSLPEMLGRPYSLVNPPGHRPHEIYAIEVESGPLSPRLKALKPGDRVWAQDKANGFFSVSEVPQAKSLWCFATGTGLGPFLSILRDPAVWRQFETVVLLHSVRVGAELTYRSLIDALLLKHSGKLRYQALVSREPVAGALHGRITSFIANGELERSLGVPLDVSSHSMLCGNPAMVTDVTALLEARGLKKHRRKSPGHYTTETYW